ncbi:MAG: lytic transglycosylase domain-containing protein [bacterium]
MPKSKATLLDEQQKLIEQLKKDNAPVYNWLVKRGVDFANLTKNASQLFSAFALLVATNQTPAQVPNSVSLDHESTTTISKDKLPPKSDLERGQKVWAEYGQFIRETAANYDLDPNLIFATIMIESGGNTNAIRYEPRINDASYGLGQLLYGTARGIGYTGTPSGLFDPATNIDLIGKYHRRNLDHYGHLTAQQLTTAYNTGSPYKKALAGHLNKFNKWYNRVENLEVDLS